MPISTHYDIPRLPVDDIHELVLVHRHKRLRLAFSAGLDGQAKLDGDPHALVSVLLVLAAIGAEATAKVDAGEASPDVTALVDRAVRNLSKATQ